jgi:hypothetical protein
LPGLLPARPSSGKGLSISLIVKPYLEHEKGCLRRLATCLSDKEEMKASGLSDKAEGRVTRQGLPRRLIDKAIIRLVCYGLGYHKKALLLLITALPAGFEKTL